MVRSNATRRPGNRSVRYARRNLPPRDRRQRRRGRRFQIHSNDRPHLLRDVFPWLAVDPVPVDENIYEWTRIFVTRELRMSGRPSEAAGRVLCAIQEFFVASNIGRLTVVCEDFWFDRLHALGWNPDRLGEPQEHEGEKLVALMLQMTPEALEQTRRFYGLNDPVVLPKAAPPAQLKSIPA